MNSRPVVFVGSSTEGLNCAKAIQVNLDRSCQVVIWSQGVFGLGGGTLEDLVTKINEVDFAILVVTPDDLTESRKVKSLAPRDNVLLELGICIGTLGRFRSFLVYDRSNKLKLPTDLAGITHASFAPHADGNLYAALGAASTMIENRISELGKRSRSGNIGNVDDDSQFRIMADLLGAVSDNFIIQMMKTGLVLHREQGILSHIGKCWYGIDSPNRYVGNGRFSVNEMCLKLVDAGLISQDLKYNVSLTDRGIVFAKWLINNNYEAKTFISPLGSWGIIDKYMQESLAYFRGDVD